MSWRHPFCPVIGQRDIPDVDRGINSTRGEGVAVCGIGQRHDRAHVATPCGKSLAANGIPDLDHPAARAAHEGRAPG